MANSPLVSIRIPVETLERLDEVAQRLYPSRRSDRSPNRSQVILDAIEFFLSQQELGEEDKHHLENQVNELLQEYQKRLEQSIKEYIDEKFLAYAYNLEHRLQVPRKVLHKTVS